MIRALSCGFLLFSLAMNSFAGLLPSKAKEPKKPGLYIGTEASRKKVWPGTSPRRLYFQKTGTAPPPPIQEGQMLYHGTPDPKVAEKIKSQGLARRNRTNGPDQRKPGASWVTTDPEEAANYAGNKGKILQRPATKEDIKYGEASLNTDGPGTAALYRDSKGWTDAPQEIHNLRPPN